MLEFADGTRYEVDNMPIVPTAAETAAFAKAAAASQEAASLQTKYEQQLAAESAAAAIEPSSKSAVAPITSGNPDRAVPLRSAEPSDPPNMASQAVRQVPANLGRQPPSAGSQLFNAKLGRFEPYEMRQPSLQAPANAPKHNLKSPPAVLQRPTRLPSDSGKANHHAVNGVMSQKKPLDQQIGQFGGLPLQAAAQHRQAQQADLEPTAKQQRSTATGSTASSAPRKSTESPWAKLTIEKPPPLAQIMSTASQPAGPASPAASKVASGESTTGVSARAKAPEATARSTSMVSDPPVPQISREEREAQYKQEMQDSAERARKRRQEAEAEREAAAERARKKAQILEEKLSSKLISEVIASPVKILTPQSDEVKPALAEASWRKEIPGSTVSTTSTHRILLPPTKHLPASAASLQEQSAEQRSLLPPASLAKSFSGANAKGPPSTADFDALTSFATNMWTKRSASQPVASQIIHENPSKPVLGDKNEILRNYEVVSKSFPNDDEIHQAASQPSLQPKVQTQSSPIVSAPRVRLRGQQSPVCGVKHTVLRAICLRNYF